MVPWERPYSSRMFPAESEMKKVWPDEEQKKSRKPPASQRALAPMNPRNGMLRLSG